MNQPVPYSTISDPSAGNGIVAEHRYTKSADPQIHYVQMSAVRSPSDRPGSAVMFVHGFPQSWRAWRQVGRLLAAKHTILIPDLRGLLTPSAL